MSTEQVSLLTVPNGATVNHSHISYSRKVIDGFIQSDKIFKKKVDKCIELIESQRT